MYALSGSKTFYSKKFPKGFFVLLFVLMFIATSFATVQGLLVLFCIDYLHLPDNAAYVLYAAFTSLIFGVPVLGGYLSSRYWGYPLAVIFGISMAAVGLYMICFNSNVFMYIGLATFLVGISTCVPSLYVLLGRIYSHSDYRRDGGFTLCYTGMNIGAVFSFLASGLIIKNWGYQSAFLISAVTMLFALLIFILGISTFLQPHIELGDSRQAGDYNKMHKPIIGFVLSLIIIPLAAELLRYAEYSDKVLIILCLLAVLFIFFLCFKIKSEQRKRFFVFLFLLSVSIGFWSLYMLAPSALTLFVMRNVDRHFMGFVVPPSEFMTLNPFFIILLGGIFSAMWTSLQKRGKSPSLPMKFSIGIALMACAYFLLALSTFLVSPGGYVSPIWIIASYILQSAGELCISPIGTAMVGTLVPQQYEGAMMGTWLLSVGVGGTISGYLAETTTNPQQLINPLITNPIYRHGFYHFGMLALTIAFITILLASRINRLFRIKQQYHQDPRGLESGK